jgi:predicted lactoylglutathione lyase
VIEMWKNQLLGGETIVVGRVGLHQPADVGTLYSRSFADLDCHKWNVFYVQNS